MPALSKTKRREWSNRAAEAADTIKLLRSLGISLTQIAAKIGVSEATVYRWLGGAAPYKHHLAKLSRLLGRGKVA